MICAEPSTMNGTIMDCQICQFDTSHYRNNWNAIHQKINKKTFIHLQTFILMAILLLNFLFSDFFLPELFEQNPER